MSVFKNDVNRILLRIQQGDEQGKELLFERTYNHLKGIAYRYLRDKNDVEDTLSNAYLKAFSSIRTFDKTKDGYSQASIVSAVYTDKQTGDEIAREEKYTSAAGTEILLRVCGVGITFEEWFVATRLENVKQIDGVTVRYGLLTEDGQKTGCAFFSYGGKHYYLYIVNEAVSSDLTAEDALHVVEELLTRK